MDIEDKKNKKKTKLEDYGGVHNAPSSFFDESEDERLFTSKFYNEMKHLSHLTDKESSINEIVKILDSDSSRSSNKKSMIQNFCDLIKKVVDKSTSYTYS